MKRIILFLTFIILVVKSDDTIVNNNKNSINKITNGKIDNISREYLQKNHKLIRSIIQRNLKYPKMAIRRSMEGRVSVSFTLKKNGDIDNLKILKYSQYYILNKCALDTIRKSYNEFPKTKKDTTLSLSIYFKLH